MPTEEPLSLTPSDMVGIIQRGLQELAGYLNRPAMAIDTNTCAAHLDRMQEFLRELQSMQLAVQAQEAASNGNVKGARN